MASGSRDGDRRPMQIDVSLPWPGDDAPRSAYFGTPAGRRCPQYDEAAFLDGLTFDVAPAMVPEPAIDFSLASGVLSLTTDSTVEEADPSGQTFSLGNVQRPASVPQTSSPARPSLPRSTTDYTAADDAFWLASSRPDSAKIAADLDNTLYASLHPGQAGERGRERGTGQRRQSRTGIVRRGAKATVAPGSRRRPSDDPSHSSVEALSPGIRRHKLPNAPGLDALVRHHYSGSVTIRPDAVDRLRRILSPFQENPRRLPVASQHRYPRIDRDVIAAVEDHFVPYCNARRLPAIPLHAVVVALFLGAWDHGLSVQETVAERPFMAFSGPAAVDKRTQLVKAFHSLEERSRMLRSTLHSTISPIEKSHHLFEIARGGDWYAHWANDVLALESRSGPSAQPLAPVTSGLLMRRLAVSGPPSSATSPSSSPPKRAASLSSLHGMSGAPESLAVPLAAKPTNAPKADAATGDPVPNAAWVFAIADHEQLSRRRTQVAQAICTYSQLPALRMDLPEFWSSTTLLWEDPNTAPIANNFNGAMLSLAGCQSMPVDALKLALWLVSTRVSFDLDDVLRIVERIRHTQWEYAKGFPEAPAHVQLLLACPLSEHRLLRSVVERYRNST